MSIEELKSLNKKIKELLYERQQKDILKELNCFKDNKFVCYHCGRTHTCEAGKTKQGKQRYKCHDCNKFMIAERNILTFSSKKVNISKRTAFRWRHKILFPVVYKNSKNPNIVKKRNEV